MKKGHEHFDQLLSYSNPFRSLSEDIDLRPRDYWGNFQRLFALAIDRSAMNFSKKHSEMEILESLKDHDIILNVIYLDSSV